MKKKLPSLEVIYTIPQQSKLYNNYFTLLKAFDPPTQWDREFELLTAVLWYGVKDQVMMSVCIVHVNLSNYIIIMLQPCSKCVEGFVEGSGVFF